MSDIPVAGDHRAVPGHLYGVGVGPGDPGLITLRAAGLIRPAGLAAFERRTPERTGVYAYENSDELTDAEASALTRDPAAAAFWEIATPGYRRICANWIHSAKREQTRTDRFATLIADCAAGRLIAPQRYGDTPAWVARAAEAARAATAD